MSYHQNPGKRGVGFVVKTSLNEDGIANPDDQGGIPKQGGGESHYSHHVFNQEGTKKHDGR